MPDSVRLDAAALRRYIESPSGPVAKDLLRRGRNVETMAKRLCPVRKGPGGGQLRASITHFLSTEAGLIRDARGRFASGAGLVCMIGSSLSYAAYVHNGTGIYGPQGTPIVPRNARALRWLGPDGKPVFAMSSKGAPGRPFLTMALAAARD